jgi:hypothetical protein
VTDPMQRSNEEKAREYVVNDDGAYGDLKIERLNRHDDIGITGDIKVIEYSAYEKLKYENERLEKYLGEPGEGNRYRLMLIENTKLKAERDDLTVENKVIKQKIIELSYQMNCSIFDENAKLRELLREAEGVIELFGHYVETQMIIAQQPIIDKIKAALGEK